MINYRQIWKNHYGPIPKDENGISYQIHHIDGNRSNNDINNLMCVSIKEHYEIHLRQRDFAAAHARPAVQHRAPHTGSPDRHQQHPSGDGREHLHRPDRMRRWCGGPR